MRLTLACLPALLLPMAACQPVESTDIRTSGVYADMSATADGDGVTDLGASLRVGGSVSNTYLDMEGGDRLVAYYADIAKIMDESNILGHVSYHSGFDVDAAETQFVISFERTEADESAPNSVLTMPSPFTVSGPTELVSRATADIVITWEPAGLPDSMTWSIWGNTCAAFQISPLGGDPGTATIPHGRVQALPGHEAEACKFDVRFERSRLGVVDPAYGEGGRAEAKQVRTITINTTP